jgi:hypothetical protein
MSKFPYERIVQWLAGPIAIVAGVIATLLAKWFGPKFGSDETAKAIVDGITFAVGAGVTYLAHSKWMSNLAAWWNKTIPPPVQDVVEGKIDEVLPPARPSVGTTTSQGGQ